MKKLNKKEMVQNLAEQYAVNVKVGDVIRAKQETHYRNKVIVAFGKSKGKVYAGQYAPHSHRVIKDSGRLLQPEIINQIIDRITELVQSMKIYLYNDQNGTGVLRHVMIRQAHATGEIMVVFVTGTSKFPSRHNLIQVLTSEFPQIKTIVQTINSRQTSVVIENKPLVLYGDGTITDILCGKKITISATAFYQIHSEQCEVLYGLAKKMVNCKPTDTLLDTYCGVGTIGLTLADSCKSVMGVEINSDAIHNARHNAKQNHVKNMKFVDMDSTEFLMEAKRYNHHFDVIVLDPPRAGTTKPFIEAATALNPRKICYISCDPKTLMRDLKGFKKCGYTTNKIELVDMFPKTEHIETVVLLSKGKVDSKKIRVEFSLEDMDMSEFQDGATYTQIKDYVLEHSGLKVSNLYISQIKRKCGIEVGKNYNLPKSEDSRQPQCPPEKEKAIREAFKYFGMI